MKTIDVLIYLLFVCNSVIMAQPEKIEIKTVKNFELRGDVKQAIITRLDRSEADGRDRKLLFTPEGLLQYDGWLSIPNNTTYTYDKAGHLVKEKSVYKDFLDDTMKSSEEVYTYNIQGLLIKRIRLGNGKVLHSESYQYDTNGHIRQVQNETGTYLYKNRYDAQKRIIKIEEFLLSLSSPLETTNITYLPNGWARHVIVSHGGEIIKEFDSKERERSETIKDLVSGKKYVSSKTYDDNDNLIKSRFRKKYEVYTYNSLGEMIYVNTTERGEDDYSGKLIDKISYTYTQHDAKGNWTERIVNNLTTHEKYTETRTITYYEKANAPATTNDPIDAFVGKGIFEVPNNGDFIASAPNTVVVGGQFRLNYTIGIDNVDNFKAPSFNNFNVLMGPSRSKTTEAIKGTVTSITYTFVLQAEKEGSFTIPGAIIESGGKTYTSNTVTIKVTAN